MILGGKQINRAKLTRHNRCYLHPVCGELDGTHTMLKGWKFLGYCLAPYEGSGKDAAVYERVEDVEGEWEFLELGLYWGHCTKEDFVIVEL